MQHFKAPVILIHPNSSSKQQTLLKLAWKLDDLSRLSTHGQRILVAVVSMKELHTLLLLLLPILPSVCHYSIRACKNLLEVLLLLIVASTRFSIILF